MGNYPGPEDQNRDTQPDIHLETWPRFENPGLRKEIDILDDAECRSVDIWARELSQDLKEPVSALYFFTKRNGDPRTCYGTRYPEEHSLFTVCGLPDQLRAAEAALKKHFLERSSSAVRAAAGSQHEPRPVIRIFPYPGNNNLAIVNISSEVPGGFSYAELDASENIGQPGYRGAGCTSVLILPASSKFIKLLRSGRAYLWSFVLRNAGIMIDPKSSAYLDAPFSSPRGLLGSSKFNIVTLDFRDYAIVTTDVDGSKTHTQGTAYQPQDFASRASMMGFAAAHLTKEEFQTNVLFFR